MPFPARYGDEEPFSGQPWQGIRRLFRWYLNRVVPSTLSPLTPVVLIVLTFAAVTLGSRGYQASRWMLSAPYPDPDRLVLISETGVMMGQQLAITPALVDFWRSHATTFAGIAGYRWDREGNGYATDGLAELLGGPPSGFVPRHIREWHRVQPDDKTLLGVIGRLKPGVTAPRAEAELRDLAAAYRRHRELYPFPAAELTPLMSRLRRPFLEYGAICGGAMLIPLLAILFGLGAEVWRGSGIRIRFWSYFAIKAVVAPFTLAAAIWEFTPATRLEIVGAYSFTGEPILVWLSIVACLCWIRWCFVDQYRRCRVCLSRLRLPVSVGSFGAVILDTAGIELACSSGHGALYLPEANSDYVVAGGWSNLLS